MNLSSFGDDVGPSHYRHVCFVAADQHVHQLFYAVGSGAAASNQDLTKMANGPNAVPEGALASFADATGEHVCYVAADQHVHQLYFNRPKWVDQDLTAVTTGPNAVPGGGIATFVDSPGEHVCYVADDLHVHQLFFDFNAKKWVDQDLTVLAHGPAAVPGGGIATTADAEFIAYVAADGQVRQLMFDSDTKSWVNVGLTPTPTAATSGGITACRAQPGFPVVSFVATDQHIQAIGTTSIDDLTAATNCPAAVPGGGITSFIDTAGSHVCFVAADQHVHQLYGGGGKLVDQDLTAMTKGPDAMAGDGIASLVDSGSELVYYLVGQELHELAFADKWTDAAIGALG